MPTKRYILCPGPVVSRRDGDEHYITMAMLARLYGVGIAECVCYPQTEEEERTGWREPEGAVYLYPREDGDYRMPDYRLPPTN